MFFPGVCNVVKVDPTTNYKFDGLPTCAKFDCTKAKACENRLYIPAIQNDENGPRFSKLEEDNVHKGEETGPEVWVFECKNTTNLTLITSKKTYLICTCNDRVLLWKEDAKTGKWYNQEVVTSLGRIWSGAMMVVEQNLFIAFSKLEEILVVRCSATKTWDAGGPLELADIQEQCVLDTMKDPNVFVGFTKDNSSAGLKLFGVAHGHKASLRLWEVPRDKDSGQGKLLDHKSLMSIKNVVGVDSANIDGENFVVIVGSDGNAEIFGVHNSGLICVNRVRVEDQSLPEAVRSMTKESLVFGKDSRSKGLSSMKPEFCVLGIRLIAVDYGSAGESKRPAGKKGAETVRDENLATSGPLRPLNDEDLKRWYPRLVLSVATTAQICLVDVRSGEILLNSSYEEWTGDGLMVNSVEIDYDPVSRRIYGIMNLLKDKNIYLISMKLNCSAPEPGDVAVFTFAVASLNSKSVLRKKLKSPAPVPVQAAKKTGSKIGRVHRERINGNGPRMRLFHGETGESVQPSPSRISTALTVCLSSESLPLPATNVNYSRDSLLSFDSETLAKVPSELAESGISQVRIAQSADGKYLAIGANVSPMVLIKTRPNIETIRLYKDAARVSSLHFAFHSQHVLTKLEVIIVGDSKLIGSNDCKTTVMDWSHNKEVLKLSFASKFNEHAGAQFYYMDKFILQPEENRLTFYSVSLRESRSVVLKAGTFALECQNITAAVGPNQFFSNYVVCGLSSKSLQLFDVDAEKVSKNILHAHSKAITCIRLNEAPRTDYAAVVSNFLLTSAPTSVDPIKLWDFRIGKSILSIGDACQTSFVPVARPALSPCGRYIASGFENNCVAIFDTRKLSSRVKVLGGIRSTVLDCTFDSTTPILWCTCKNGSILSFSGV